MTHCPHCQKVITGEVRSFCVHCREVFRDVDDRWFSTKKFWLSINCSDPLLCKLN